MIRAGATRNAKKWTFNGVKKTGTERSQDSQPDADLWSRADLRHFDPLGAYSDALSVAHEQIVNRLLSELGEVDLDAGA